MGLAHGATLDVLTTGLDEDKTQLLPSCPRPVAETVAAEVLGDSAAVTAPVVAHGRQARSRQYVRHLLVALLFVVAIVIEEWVLVANLLNLPGGRAVKLAVVVIAVPLALATAELRYRRLGHALTGHYLVSCTGTITAMRTALPTDGIVGWRIHQSFWDRRRVSRS